jgi:hypothetical protein
MHRPLYLLAIGLAAAGCSRTSTSSAPADPDPVSAPAAKAPVTKAPAASPRVAVAEPGATPEMTFPPVQIGPPPGSTPTPAPRIIRRLAKSQQTGGNSQPESRNLTFTHLTRQESAYLDHFDKMVGLAFSATERLKRPGAMRDPALVALSRDEVDTAWTDSLSYLLVPSRFSQADKYMRQMLTELKNGILAIDFRNLGVDNTDKILNHFDAVGKYADLAYAEIKKHQDG